MAFAVGLLQQNRELSECLPLMADSALADRRATLENLLG
jgi:ArsR family metal-binding transcriptional regulator